MAESRAILTLKDVYVAANPKVFVVLKTDGSLDTENTGAAFTVYSNQKGKKDGTKYTSRFDVVVRGSQVKTVACHLMEGKQITELNLFASINEGAAIKVDENGTPISDNGKHVRVGLPRFVMQSITFGNDPEKLERQKLATALRVKCDQGTLPPMEFEVIEEILNTVTATRRDKKKSEDFDLRKANETGKWGNASLWSKDRGNWVPKTYQEPQQQPEQQNGNITPEMMKEFQAFMAMKRAAADQEKQAAAEAVNNGNNAPQADPDVPEDIEDDEIPF